MEEEMTKLTKDEVEKDIKAAEEAERPEGETKKAEEEALKEAESEKAKTEEEGVKEPEREEAEPEKEALQTSESEKVHSEEEVSKEPEAEKAETEEGVIETPHKKARIFAIAFGMVVFIILGCIYGRGVYYYKRNFFPQYKINSVDCGNLTLQEAADKIQQWYRDNYRLKLVDRNGEEMAVVLPADIQMVFPIEEEMSQILEEQNAYGWLFYIFSKEDFSREILFVPEYDIEALESLLAQKGLFEESGREEPQDAYIGEYQQELRQFEIVPDKEGTILEQERTVTCAAEALTGLQDSLNLYETGCFKVAKITADNKQLKEQLEKLNRVVGACIIYDWNGTQEVVDGELIHQWLVFDGKDITLDEEEIAAYVAQKAKEYDTYGKKRKFVTTTGLTLTLPSGAYGWKTDKNAETEALIKLILEGAATEREPIYSSQGWAKGDDDIGDSYVEINLTDQHLYLYVDGELILETDFVSGNAANGNSTPAGVFGLTYKTRNAVLRGADYETPVHYWMPFNGNIGMHDATWRRSFGGDIYLTNGSHGCINLPLKMAKSIYGYISAGFPVICYYY